MKSYFNTTLDSLPTELENIKNARKQEQAILVIFKTYKVPLTPSFIWQVYCTIMRNENTPITSIRRAISVLKSKGLVEKCNKKAEGLYGKPEFYYELC